VKQESCAISKDLTITLTSHMGWFILVRHY